MNLAKTVMLAGEADTAALGARLAAIARKGDAIGLRGDLGAGKTTLARGFIQALTSSSTEVPSPTFTLVQTYDTAKGEVAHFDLYRLKNADEALELGLDDAVVGGIALIEWPERLGSAPPTGMLEVMLDLSGNGRRARLAGGPAWQDRLQVLG